MSSAASLLLSSHLFSSLLTCSYAIFSADRFFLPLLNTMLTINIISLMDILNILNTAENSHRKSSDQATIRATT